MAPKKKQEGPQLIVIPKPEISIVELECVGIEGDGVIVNRVPESAKQSIREKEQDLPKQPKGARKPQEEYEECLYVMRDGYYGFPAIAFKKAAVRAAKLLGLVMIDTQLKFFVRAEDRGLVTLFGEPEMREDWMGLGRGSPLRYRAYFPKWAVRLAVEHDKNMISSQQVINLMVHAGSKVGVGDWRPEKGGNNGRFGVRSPTALTEKKKSRKRRKAA